MYRASFLQIHVLKTALYLILKTEQTRIQRFPPESSFFVAQVTRCAHELSLISLTLIQYNATSFQIELKFQIVRST